MRAETTRRCGLAIGALALLLSASAALARETECVAARGRTKHTVESQCRNLRFAGQVRTYRLYAPAKTRTSMPLLLVLHGGGGSGSAMEGLTLGQFNRLADARGFIVVYPDGIGRGWNDGRNDMKSKATQDNVNDVGFLRALVEQLARQYSIDRKRVYATGISNGGLMSYRLACDAADVFAAVAPVAASMSVELAPECHPARPVSIAIIDGVDDPVMPWKGGVIKVLWSRRGTIVSAMDSFQRWLALDRCDKPITDSPVDRVHDDGTTLVIHTARHCADDSEARLYEIRGGGHTWPGGSPHLSERIVGKVSRELNASEVIWEFFARHSR